VTNDRRLLIQLDDLARWNRHRDPRYVIAYGEFSETHGSDVLFELEFLSTLSIFFLHSLQSASYRKLEFLGSLDGRLS
jgi:hypothetical protein